MQRLAAGQYQLTITDGNACETVSEVYTIEDAGNLQVLNVELTQPHCGRPDGQIIVHGFNPSGLHCSIRSTTGLPISLIVFFSGLIVAGYGGGLRMELGASDFILIIRFF